jgi:hypothetical protein
MFDERLRRGKWNISISCPLTDHQTRGACLDSNMLRDVNLNVNWCAAQAGECRQAAAQATSTETKELFLELERSWLGLARSYEHIQTLHAFLKAYSAMNNPSLS